MSRLKYDRIPIWENKRRIKDLRMCEKKEMSAENDTSAENETYLDALSLLKHMRRSEADFDEVMAWLGKMVAASNLLEQVFQKFLVHLLQCRNKESAIVISRERRRFDEMVDLIEKLLAVYFSDQSVRDEFKALGNRAKRSYEERNKCVHSLWFSTMFNPESNSAPAQRYKDGKTAAVVNVQVTELATLERNFGKCTDELCDLIGRCKL